MNSPQLQQRSYADLANQGVPRNAIVTVLFPRSNVERGDFSEFTSAFNVDRMPQMALRRCMGKLHFAVEGYDEDQRELREIPEVRAFYKSFYDEWPHWFFFGTLEAIPPMVLCRVDDITQTTIANRTVSVIARQGIDLIFDALIKMNPTWQRAGLTEELLKHRWRRILGLFGLPADF